MSANMNLDEAIKKPFGTVFTDKMVVSNFKDGAWSQPELMDHQPLSFSPATHVFHYGSSCFEGLKAHRQGDHVSTFRLKDHMKRLVQSAGLLCLPVPDADVVANMIRENIRVCSQWTPNPPGSLYIRPTLIGTLASIGAAASPSTEAMLYILLSPVGDYFSTGAKPLRVMLDDEGMRCAPHFGMAKAGGNYASALGRIMEAKEKYQAGQILFAPGGDVQETGAANFLLINDHEIVTRDLDKSFLHGVTRDSILKLGAKLGYKVSERRISVEEVLEWTKTGEAALSGTAAILSGVGTIIYRGKDYTMGNGEIGKNTTRLRQALLDLQQGRSEDTFGWMEQIC